MAYGLGTRAPASSAAVKRAMDRAAGTWGGYQAWRPLDADERLRLVEQALQCANDRIDDFPLAL